MYPLTMRKFYAFRRGPHLFARVGLGYQHVAISRAPSWDHPRYPRLGAWLHHRGLTLRYRGWLLHVTVRD